MANAVSEVYNEIYQLNFNLLEMAQQGKWKEFIALAEIYVIKLHEVISTHDSSVQADEHSDFRIMFNNLIENETKIEQKIKNRLADLKTEMSTLNRSKKCNAVYSLGSINAFH